LEKRIFKLIEKVFILFLLLLDMTWGIVSATIGVLLVVESLFLLAFPKKTQKLARKLTKNLIKIRKIGWIELLIGFVLVLIGVWGAS
jgi:uncharacterized protein YjeT (DUF2065 family)